MCWFESVNRDSVSFVTEVNLEELWLFFDDMKLAFLQALEGGVPSVMPDEDLYSHYAVGQEAYKL